MAINYQLMYFISMKNTTKAAFLVTNSERKLVNDAVRNAVLASYDNVCQHCLGKSGELATAVDHIIPLNPNKSDIENIAKLDLSKIHETLDCLENMVAACQPCNSSKGNRLLPQDQSDALLKMAVVKADDVRYILKPLSNELSVKNASPTSKLIYGAVIGDERLVADNLDESFSYGIGIQKAGEIAAWFGHLDCFEVLNPFLDRETRSKILREFEQHDWSDIKTEHVLINLLATGHNHDELLGFLFPSKKAGALSKALYRHRVDIFEDIVEIDINRNSAGAEIRLQYGEDRRLIYCAAANELEGVERALKDNSDPRVCNNLALQYALAHRNGEMALKLIQSGADHTVNGYEAFKVAIFNGHKPLFDTIQALHVPHDEKHEALIDVIDSAKADHLEEMLCDLFKLGVCIEDTDAFAVSKICLEPLRTYGYGYNANPWSRIYDREKYIPIINKIMENGGRQHVQYALSQVIAKSSAPTSGANQSFRQDSIEKNIVKALIENGADIYSLGNRAYLWACAFGEVEIVSKFIDRSRDDDSIDWKRGYELAAANNEHLVMNAINSRGLSCKSKRTITRKRISYTKDDILNAAQQHIEQHGKRPRTNGGEVILGNEGYKTTWRQINNSLWQGGVKDVEERYLVELFDNNGIQDSGSEFVHKPLIEKPDLTI